MGVQGFERRLERLVEGTFGKAFRSGLQPVEIARKLLREMDNGRTIGVRGTVAPNYFLVCLCEEDAERFDDYADVLERELAEEAREHAREDGYHFLGPVQVELVEDPRLRKGDLEVEPSIKEGPGGRVGALVLSDGRRITLGAEPFVIGRLADCDLPVEDPLASRRHAEIRPEPDAYRLVDLGSLNGTMVNAAPAKDHVLMDGDLIGIGAVSIRFEASVAAGSNVSEGLLTVLKFCFLALLYLFLFRVVRIVRLELKPAKVVVPTAAAAPAEPMAAPPATKVKRSEKSRGGAAVLHLLDPPARTGEMYALAEEVTVGRAPGCGVVLEEDTFVSQVHARLFRRGRETYVEDLGSTNGTMVNGVRIEEVTRLHRGDQVQFGNTTAEITK